jgi:deoxyribonuclease-4
VKKKASTKLAKTKAPSRKANAPTKKATAPRSNKLVKAKPAAKSAAPKSSTARRRTPTIVVGSSRAIAADVPVAPRTRPDPSILLGAHVSIAGGTHEAPPRAHAIAATAMQVFSKMANRWAERECLDDECVRFRAALSVTDVSSTMAHDSYLINLASPDPVLRARSIESFAAELRRCNALGIGALVSHPGNFMDDRESGIARNADAITQAMEQVPGNVILCLETTAGSGTSLGATFEELAAIIARVAPSVRARVNVCVDTCHIHSAGYDLVNDYDGVWARFEDALGFAAPRAMHLNDSKTPFASRRDRHELIGEGSLGETPFRRIMNDPRFARVPKVIETPKLDDAETTDRRMLERLRGYLASE